jgi:hypothetical protein
MHHRRAHAGHAQLAQPKSVQTEIRWLKGRLRSWMLKSYMERQRPSSPPEDFKCCEKPKNINTHNIPN